MSSSAAKLLGITAGAGNVIDFPALEADLVRVKPGIYHARYVRHAGVYVFRSAKIRVDLRLMEHDAIVIPRWYRVQDHRGGRIKAPVHSDLVREMSAVTGTRVRKDRIHVKSLEEYLLEVMVEDVRTDSRQTKLADINRYSIITKIIAGMQIRREM